MPEYRFAVPRALGLSRALSDIPPPFKSLLRRGCLAIAQMSPEALDRLVPLTKDFIQGPEAILSDKLPDLGMDAENTGAAVSAAGVLASLVAGGARIEDILDALPAVLEEPVGSRLSALVNKLEKEVQDQDLRPLLRKRRLSEATLPSLSKLETSVDVRIDFEKDTTPIMVPVAIAFLDTDAVHHRLWFQMTENQVEDLIKQLEKLRENLKRAAGIRLP